ncbi:MAG: TetR/AcrR family transcriptional regulator [Gammaproteobacteria bacterium]|jgi:AcrR family transcriptional regulator|nr:TetR family transcriptional regulator [Gammaproteobacteria bacterium]
MAFNRAMTEAQKEARRADILKVALQRFTLMPYESLSMADTADAAGVAKGTLYLYFRSKEELFLAIYTDQLNGWFDELDRELEHAKGEASIAAFLKVMGGSLTRRPQLLRLIAILHTVLERNLDESTAQHFKSWLKGRMQKTGRLLEIYLPFLEAGQGAQLLLKIDALIIGFQHLAEPSGVMREVLKAEDMALFRVDLEAQLLETLRTLLMGLAYEAKYRNEK